MDPSDPAPAADPAAPPPSYGELYSRFPGASRVLAEAFSMWLLENARLPEEEKRDLRTFFSGPLTIEFRVNGVELPFLAAMEAAFAFNREHVNREAAAAPRGKLEEAFPDRLRAAAQKLLNLEYSLGFEVRKAVREAFPGVHLDGDD